jgi:hypothetical protein
MPLPEEYFFGSRGFCKVGDGFAQFSAFVNEVFQFSFYLAPPFE